MPSRILRRRARAARPLPARPLLRPATLALAVAAALASVPAWAQPSGANAIHGTAVLQQQGSTLNVHTTNGAHTSHSAIDWRSFGIPAGTATHIHQPNAASTSINRVLGPDPSAIYGTLWSNGRVVLVNPAGITVGAGAVVDTAAFTASTLRMTDADALAGRLRFDGGAAGPLRVDGQVLARQGDVVLVGLRVETGPQALVESPNGATVLAAGQKVEITGRGLEGIYLQVQAPADEAVQLGTLKGDAVGIFAGTLRHSGLVQADAVSVEGGKVVLKAAHAVDIDGHVKAFRGQQGGHVHATADKVVLRKGSTIDVSGRIGGGEALIGGGWQGQDTRVANARETIMETGATVLANAGERGDGGTVVLWADDLTRFGGHIEAKGGLVAGDGGRVETSGKQRLQFRGTVDTSAPAGRAGLLLLDPQDLIIANGSGASGDGEVTDTVVNANDPDTTSDVTISEQQLESLTITSTLMLNATRDVIFQDLADDVLNLAGLTGGRSMHLTAGRHIIAADQNDRIHTARGNVNMTATTGDILLGGVNTFGGSLWLDAAGAVTARELKTVPLFSIAGSPITVTAGGAITLGGGGDIDARGIGGFPAGNVRAESTGGAVTVLAGTTLYGKDLRLEAVGGISGGGPSTPVDLQVERVRAVNTGSGNIVLNDTGTTGLVLNNLTIPGNAVENMAPAGTVSITSSGALTVQHGLATAGGDMSLTALGDITFDTSLATLSFDKSTGGTTALNLTSGGTIGFTGGGQVSFSSSDPGGTGILDVNLNGGQIDTVGATWVQASTSNSTSNLVNLNVLGSTMWSNDGKLTLNQNGRLVMGTGAAFANVAGASLDGAAGPHGGVLGAGHVVNDGTISLTQGSLSIGNFHQGAGTFSYGMGSVTFGDVVHTGGNMNFGPGVDMAATNGFFSGGGTFNFNGNNLSMTQAAGNLVTGTGTISANTVTLDAPAGSLVLGGTLFAETVTLNAGFDVDFQSIAAHGVSTRPNGGAVSIVAGNDVRGTLSLGARGSSSGTMGNGGTVLVQAGGNIDLPFSVGAAGGGSSTGTAGGHGGSVTLRSTGGQIFVHRVEAQGGVGGTGRGGDGGHVVVDGAGLVEINHIDAYGGNGSSMGGSGAGGNGGQVQVAAGSGLILNDRISTAGGNGGNLLASAGQAGHGGNAGSVTLSLDGFSDILGAIEAHGGDGGNASGTAVVSGNGGNGSTIDVQLRAPGAVLQLDTGTEGMFAEGGAAGLSSSGMRGTDGATGSVATSGGIIYVLPSSSTPDLAPSSGTVASSFNVDGHWTNSSQLVLDPGAWVRVHGNMVNNGTVEVWDGGLLSLGVYQDVPVDQFTPGGRSFANGASGVLQGNGYLQAGTISNEGKIAPGGVGSLGQLTLVGDVALQPTSVLALEALATTPYTPGHSYDQLRVQGALSMGGQVLIAAPEQHSTSSSALALAIPTTTPAETSNLELIHADAASGSFSLISGPADLLALARLRVGDTIQNLPGGTASQLIAAIAQLLPGVPLSTIQEVLTQSLNNAIAPEEPAATGDDDTERTEDAIVTDAACIPA